MAGDQQTKFTTSFIPKKPVATPQAKSVVNRGPGLIQILSVFFFFLSILVAVGMYGWKFQVENTIESQLEDLRQARAEFDEETISQATRLNERIIAVRDLLNSHVAPSNIFSTLEENILQTVRISDLDYVTDEEGDININGNGSALGFESVVLQSDEFGFTGNFRDVIFSDVQTNQDGQSVTFSLSASIDDRLVLYRKQFDSEFGLDEVEEAESAGSVNNIFE